jgi:hypothetical protein
MDARQTFVRELGDKLAGRRVTLTVTEEKDQRSLDQNARFWLICEQAAIVLSQGRPVPLNKEEAKLALCRAFLGVLETPFGLIPRGTRHLTVAQMSELQDKITGHFASIGQALPLDGVA